MLGLGSSLVYQNSIFEGISFVNAFSTFFDGADDLGTVASYNGVNPGADSATGFSTSIWVYSTQSSAAAIRSDRMFAKSGSGKAEYACVVDAVGRPRFFLYFSNNTSAATRYRFVPNFTVQPNTWYHMVFTWDATKVTTDTSAITGYINNVKYTNALGNTVLANTPTSDGLSVTPSDQTLEIGRQTIGGHYWKGYIDEFSIFNTVLSDSDVNAMYNSGEPTDLSSQAGLVGYWRMGEDDTGSTITNLSSAAGATDMALPTGAAITDAGIATSQP